MTECNQTNQGDNFILYKNIKSVYYSPETFTILQANYNSKIKINYSLPGEKEKISRKHYLLYLKLYFRTLYIFRTLQQKEAKL